MEKLLYLFDVEPVALEGLCSWLSKRPDIKIAAKATSVQDALQIIFSAEIPENAQAIAITELSFRRIGEQKNEDGFKIIKAINESKKPIKVLVFSSLDSGGYLRTCMSQKYRVSGFVSKECDINTLFTAIDFIHSGELYFSENLKARLEEAENIYKKLSKTEKIVLEHVFEDMSNHEIAEKLGLSKRTIENYISHIYGKANVYNRYTLFIKIGGGG